jgi:PPOX class probable F420-dependent enzyme
METQTIERPVQRPAADLEALFPGRYLSVTSFKRDGTGVATPVWSVSDGKRCLHLPICTRRRSGASAATRVSWSRHAGWMASYEREPVPARAEVLTATAELERVQKLLTERYKISYRVVMLFYRLGRRVRGQKSVADGAALAITVE